MWIWRRMEKISWTSKDTNEEALERVGISRQLINMLRNRKKNWVAYVLRGSGLLKELIEGRMEQVRRRKTNFLNSSRYVRKKMQFCTCCLYTYIHVYALSIYYIDILVGSRHWVRYTYASLMICSIITNTRIRITHQCINKYCTKCTHLTSKHRHNICIPLHNKYNTQNAYAKYRYICIPYSHIFNIHT